MRRNQFPIPFPTHIHTFGPCCVAIKMEHNLIWKLCNAVAFVNVLPSWAQYIPEWHRNFIVLAALQFPLDPIHLSSDWILNHSSRVSSHYSFCLFSVCFSIYRSRRPSDLSLCVLIFPSALWSHTSIVYWNIIDRIINDDDINNRKPREKKENEMIFSWLYLLPCVVSNQQREKKERKKMCTIVSLMLNFIVISRVLLYRFIFLCVFNFVVAISNRTVNRRDSHILTITCRTVRSSII